MSVKVTVVSAGRFWAFDLAEQMRRHGCLKRLYTCYPRFKVDASLRPLTRTFPWVFTAYMAAGRFGFRRLENWLDWLAIDTFDRWVAQNLEPTVVIVALSGYGLHARRAARQSGALTVCDRGSSHIAYANRLLAEEFARQGFSYKPIDPRLVEKEKKEYAEADLITVPSTFAYNSFLKEGIASEKLAKIPYGVDLSMFNPLPKEDEIFRIVYVGQLSLRKGIPYLLEAVKGLDLPRVELVLIGGLTEEIKPILARYQDPRIHYLGFIPRPRLSYYYSQGSVFVLASVEEGLAMVQAQAMACGLPVIATTNTGAADLFTDGVEGFIVPIRDPVALREKIIHLYENPDVREEMGRAALRRVSSLGGWETYGKLALATYREHHAKKRAGGRQV
jgi:glycosyltransferase involved in cell wall biosynthesis